MTRHTTTAVERLKRTRRDRGRSVVFARQGLGLHAMVTSAGVERRSSAEYDWHGLRRGAAEFVLMQYTLSGAGALTFEGREMVVRPGRLLLLHFPHDHRYRFDRKLADHWRFFWICLNGEQVMQTWREVVARRGPVWEIDERERLVEMTAEVCGDVVAGRVDSPWRASAMAYGLSMELLEWCGSEAGVDNDAEDRGMHRVLGYVQSHLSERIGVEEMAGVAGYSRYHFTRLFARRQGISPGQYLVRQRLRQVVRLLQTTDEPVKQIAAKCGFADANYLCKAFAKHYGITPGAVRRSGMYAMGSGGEGG